MFGVFRAFRAFGDFRAFRVLGFLGLRVFEVEGWVNPPPSNGYHKVLL